LRAIATSLIALAILMIRMAQSRLMLMGNQDEFSG
jgi:hypothetical protein